MSFTLAIIGRPNVGKSTLFNRLTGKKHALVHDAPGVTRDVREGDAHIGPMHFTVLDTAGLEEAAPESLSARMTQQTMTALARADVALLLVDGRAGITPSDRHFAGLVRKSGKPVILAVNKAEGSAADGALMEAFSLGLGEPVALSAEHGEGLSELFSALTPFENVPPEGEEGEESSAPLMLAIAGRPNVGKSTLVNALLGEERVLTGPEAGITRDAISVPFAYGGREIRLVDTAGMRKRANVQAGLEKLSVADSLRAIVYAEVVVVVMDATQAFEKQDIQIADLVAREGRAVVLAVNKWDRVGREEREAFLKEAGLRIPEVLPQLRGVRIMPISAARRQGLKPLMEAVFSAHSTWNRRFSTAALNRWLEVMLAQHTPPLVNGRRLKIRYMTQAKARPPTFALFSNMSEVPEHYLRYLANGLRESFGLHGVPIRINVKKSKNPYEKG